MIKIKFYILNFTHYELIKIYLTTLVIVSKLTKNWCSALNIFLLKTVYFKSIKLHLFKTRSFQDKKLTEFSHQMVVDGRVKMVYTGKQLRTRLLFRLYNRHDNKQAAGSHGDKHATSSTHLIRVECRPLKIRGSVTSQCF